MTFRPCRMKQKTAGNHHYPGLDSALPKYRDLVEKLVAEYRPLANNLCQSVSGTLNESERSLKGQNGKVFLLLDTQPAQKTQAMDLRSFIWYWPNSRHRPVS
jgi:hypothetical protein